VAELLLKVLRVAPVISRRTGLRNVARVIRSSKAPEASCGTGFLTTKSAQHLFGPDIHLRQNRCRINPSCAVSRRFNQWYPRRKQSRRRYPARQKKGYRQRARRFGDSGGCIAQPMPVVLQCV